MRISKHADLMSACLLSFITPRSPFFPLPCKLHIHLKNMQITTTVLCKRIIPLCIESLLSSQKLRRYWNWLILYSLVFSVLLSCWFFLLFSCSRIAIFFSLCFHRTQLSTTQYRALLNSSMIVWHHYESHISNVKNIALFEYPLQMYWSVWVFIPHTFFFQCVHWCHLAQQIMWSLNRLETLIQQD